MILRKHPKQDSVFFSNNTLELHLESEIGAGHVFEIFISVNDELLFQQAWAKRDDFNCYVDLKGQFDGVFDNDFTAPNSPSLTNVTEKLFKKISITVKEFDAANNIEVGSELLPDFYVIKNRFPAEFDDSKKVFCMAQISTLNKVDHDSIIMLPFWFNTSDDVDISVKDNNGVGLWGQIFSVSKGLYSLNIPLDGLTTLGKEFIEITVTDGSDTFSTQYTLKDFFRYAKNQLVIENHYGFFEAVSFFGRLSKEAKFTKIIKETYQNIKEIVDDDSDVTYALSTGYLDETQTKDVDIVNGSRKSYLLSEGIYKSIIINTRSSKLFETDLFAYSNVIRFELNHVVNVNEDDKYTTN